MKCVGCGKEIAQAAHFCTHCGAAQPPADARAANAAGEAIDATAQAPAATGAPKRGGSIAFVIGIVIAVGLVALAAWRVLYIGSESHDVQAVGEASMQGGPRAGAASREPERRTDPASRCASAGRRQAAGGVGGRQRRSRWRHVEGGGIRAGSRARACGPCRRHQPRRESSGERQAFEAAFEACASGGAEGRWGAGGAGGCGQGQGTRAGRDDCPGARADAGSVGPDGGRHGEMHARGFHQPRHLRPAGQVPLLRRILGQGSAMPGQPAQRQRMTATPGCAQPRPT